MIPFSDEEINIGRSFSFHSVTKSATTELTSFLGPISVVIIWLTAQSRPPQSLTQTMAALANFFSPFEVVLSLNWRCGAQEQERRWTVLEPAAGRGRIGWEGSG